MGIFRIKRFSSNEKKEKLYFLAQDGTAFTGEDIAKRKAEILGEYRNGSVKNAKTGLPHVSKPSPESLTRQAFIREKIRRSGNDEGFGKVLQKLEKQGFIKNVTSNGFTYEEPSKLGRNVAKVKKAVAKFIKKRLRK